MYTCIENRPEFINILSIVVDEFLPNYKTATLRDMKVFEVTGMVITKWLYLGYKMKPSFPKGF